MSDELQCCPFCGGKGVEAEFQSDIGGGDFQYVFGVSCSNESCLVRPRCNVRGERGYEREGDVPNVEARKSAIAAWNTRRPTPEQSGEAQEQLESARRVLKVLDDEASKRRQKYGSAIYSARDVDPDVYDIAKRIIDRAAMDRSALGRDAENTPAITANSAENVAQGGRGDDRLR